MFHKEIDNSKLNIKIEDRDNLCVVVVGFNRLYSLRRLLSTLLNADYGKHSVPLVISIDKSDDDELYEYVRRFEWPYGNKYVFIQESRLGLRRHILRCGDLSQSFRAIILLEDDIYVGPQFYNYTYALLDYYENDNRIGGFSLYLNEIFGNVPISYYQDGGDTFLRQFPSSWGECWSRSQWKVFREWLSNFLDDDFTRIDMPQYIKDWKNSWLKYFAAYLVDSNKYFVYPRISQTTCFSDQGVHINNVTMISQVNLQLGPRDYCFKPFNYLVRYDIYGVNEEIYEWLGIERKELCVDWYGINSNINKCRYILTPIILPFKTVQSFGLFLRPIELNIKYGISGTDLKVYDTRGGNGSAYGHSLPMSSIRYYLRDFSTKLLIKYCFKKLIDKICHKNYLLKQLTKGIRF